MGKHIYTGQVSSHVKEHPVADPDQCFARTRLISMGFSAAAEQDAVYAAKCVNLYYGY